MKTVEAGSPRRRAERPYNPPPVDLEDLERRIEGFREREVKFPVHPHPLILRCPVHGGELSFSEGCGEPGCVYSRRRLA